MSLRGSRLLIVSILMVLIFSLFAGGCSNKDTNSTNTSNNTSGSSDNTNTNTNNNASAAYTPQTKKFDIGGGSLGGAFYIVGGQFAKEIEATLKIPSVVSVSEGAAENIKLVDSNQIEGAIVSSNALYLAWNGDKPYDKKYQDMRLLMAIYPLPNVWVALEKSGLKNVTDLKGKKLGVGVGPATWDPVSGPILSAHGLDYDKGIKKVYGGFSDLYTQLGDGVIDAAVSSISGDRALLPATVELNSTKPLIGLKFDQAAIDQLAKDYPYFKPVDVPAGVVPGWDKEPYKTISQATVYLIVNKNLSNDDAYNITKAIFNGLSKMAESNNALAYPANNHKSLTEQFGSVAFHDGAIKFWQEQGLWK